MHSYELKIAAFMQRVGTGSVVVSEELLKPAAESIDYFLRKMMEEDPNRPFTLRLSSIGRPLCQQKMQQRSAPALDDELSHPMRMFFGGVLEATTVCILRAAGINVGEEQTPVKLQTAGEEINGTLDLVIDGKVWDIKTASPFMFKEKWDAYESIKADDAFGYLPQLYGYSKARGLPPGGWIVIDKSSGAIKILEVPLDYEADMEEALARIEANVKALLDNEEFSRCYKDLDETFKKKFTGNKVLDMPCTFCKYRYECWPGLQYKPSVLSTAFEKPYKHYTVLANAN